MNKGRRKSQSPPPSPSKKRKQPDTAVEQGRSRIPVHTKARADAFLSRPKQPTTKTTTQPRGSTSRIPVASPSRNQTSFTFQLPVQRQTNMSGTTTKAAAFKIPRYWDTSSPKFVTEDADDLLDFIDQVGEIIELAGIKDDNEKKSLLTGYLPVRKRNLWRNIENYATLTFEEFLKEMNKAYPELKKEKEGTMEEMVKLCRANRGIRIQDEGKLKRFGMEFSALYKLSQTPAILLNKEACLKYLDALDTSFADQLRTSVSQRNLLKADINKAAGVQPTAPPAGSVDHRKEDPILLKDLIDMAEQLAATGIAGTTWEGYDDRYKSSILPAIKIERRDEKLEGLSEEVAGIRDSIMVIQKEVQSSQAQLLKAFQMHVKDPPPHREASIRDAPPHKEVNQLQDQTNRSAPPPRGNFRTNNCFYCDGQDHIARDCVLKISHINKGWLIIEDGIQKLGDGNLIPRGRGPTGVRVEEYYLKRPANQNWQSTEVLYNGESQDTRDMDSMWDEMRTLRVRLNQIANNGNNMPTAQYAYSKPQTMNYGVPQAVQPTYMAQTMVPQASAQDQAFNESFARAMTNFLNANVENPEQFLLTRGGKETAPRSEKGF